MEAGRAALEQTAPPRCSATTLGLCSELPASLLPGCVTCMVLGGTTRLRPPPSAPLLRLSAPHKAPRLPSPNTHPDVKLAREEALRNAGSVQPCTRDVHHSHEEEPAHLPDRGGLHEPLGDGEVHGGHHAAQPQPQKDTCSKRREQQEGAHVRGAALLLESFVC